jgi:hypothetical protein
MSTTAYRIPVKENFYNQVLPELRKKTEERGHRFCSQGTPGTSMSELLDELSVQPGVRFPFGIEANLSVLVGFIIIPDENRIHSEIAWNRFDQNLRERIARAERRGSQDKSLSCVIIQIWERERNCVLIPFKELDGILSFRRTGDFRVLKDCGEFFLKTPRDEPNIRLKDRLDHIFEFL